MTEQTRTEDLDSLNLIRAQCGTLELALQNEADPARRSQLTRELAECRQRVFEAEQRAKGIERETATGGPAGDQQPATVRESIAQGGSIEAADERPDYAGLYAAERNQSAELRAEVNSMEGQGISRERERLHSSIEHAQAGQQAEELSRAGIPPELAAEYAARILARDESFSGEVVEQIERDDQGRAYVIEADGDRVIVPEVDGAEMDVGDDVEIMRDQQGNYEVETGYDYGR